MQYIKRHWSLHRLLTVEAMGLLALFGFALVLELQLAVSLFWQFNLLMVALALLVTLPSYLAGQRIKALWLFLGFNVALLVLYLLVLNPIKPFTQVYQDIANGMTREQVQERFNQRFPAGGRFRQPQPYLFHVSPATMQENKPYLAGNPNQAISYQLDPTDGEYDAEVLVVYFKDGKVVGTQYLTD